MVVMSFRVDRRPIIWSVLVGYIACCYAAAGDAVGWWLAWQRASGVWSQRLTGGVLVTALALLGWRAGCSALMLTRRTVGWIGLGLVGWWVLSSIPLEAERLHLLQYALLAVLTVSALHAQQDWREVSGRRMLIAGLGVVLVVGVIEELVQSLLPGRVGSLRDVGLDLAGGSFGLWCQALWRMGDSAAS